MEFARRKRNISSASLAREGAAPGGKNCNSSRARQNFNKLAGCWHDDGAEFAIEQLARLHTQLARTALGVIFCTAVVTTFLNWWFLRR
jgi:hypothetical protein